MNKADVHHQRIARMSFASVYPMYVEKVEKKGRTKAELHTVIEWLTGFDGRKLRELIEKKVTFEEFFRQASLNPNAHLITGVICGYRIEEIENPLTRKVCTWTSWSMSWRRAGSSRRSCACRRLRPSGPPCFPGPGSAHWLRRAIRGSTDAARRAGIQQARAATAVSRAEIDR
jgi:hypothetical protein